MAGNSRPLFSAAHVRLVGSLGNALYPLIRRLQQESLIREREVPSRSGRPRRVYSITPAGKRRFHDLMMRLGDYQTDFEDWSRIRLANLRHINHDERAILWQDFAHYVEQFLADTATKIDWSKKRTK